MRFGVIAPRAREMEGGMEKGLIVVVTGPSGAGKSTVARLACAAGAGLEQAVTVTTRPPRRGEEDGRDYRFLDGASFDRLEESGGLVECSRARGAAYGTPVGELERIWARGKVPVLVLDADGARAVADRYPGAVTVFIDADFDQRRARREVVRRLRARGESPSAVRSRMSDNERAWARCDECDYVLFNRAGSAEYAARALVSIAEEARDGSSLDALERACGARCHRAPARADDRTR